jgi:hypothetical protein
MEAQAEKRRLENQHQHIREEVAELLKKVRSLKIDKKP